MLENINIFFYLQVPNIIRQVYKIIDMLYSRLLHESYFISFEICFYITNISLARL